MKKKVLIVDLDGTLYKINTFHYFLRFLITDSLKKLDFLLPSLIVLMSVLRLFKMILHSKLKYFILKEIKKRDISYLKFVESISKYRRDFLLDNTSGYDIKILATAAPCCYANIIAGFSGFDTCIGTDFPTEKYDLWFENIKEVKKDNVLNYLKNLDGNFEIDTVVTDHLDDLALLKLAKRGVLVNPNSYMKQVLSENRIIYKSLKV